MLKPFMFLRATVAVSAILVIALGAPTPVLAIGIDMAVSASTGVNNASGANSSSYFTTGGYVGTSAVSSGLQQGTTTSSNGSDALAQASMNVLASGAVEFSSLAHVTVAPSTFSSPFLSIASGGVTILDELTITSSTLATGTAVQVAFQMSLENTTVSSSYSTNIVDSQLVDYGRVVAQLDVNGGGVYAIDRQTCCAGLIPLEQTALNVVNTHIGDTLLVRQRFVSNAVINGYYSPLGSQGIFDASVAGGHTGYTTFTAMTAGVGFTSALGYSYTAPVNSVPEPASGVLLGSGFAGLAAWRIRQRWEGRA